MKIHVITLVLLTLTIVFVAAGSYAYDPVDVTIDIKVAPNTLNIQSQGTVVTVHTDIAYGAVVGSSVTLNDIEIESYKADNRGNFVAKFSINAVKELVDEGVLELGTITLTLEGMTTDDKSFLGSQDITVVDNVPAGK